MHARVTLGPYASDACLVTEFTKILGFPIKTVFMVGIQEKNLLSPFGDRQQFQLPLVPLRFDG